MISPGAVGRFVDEVGKRRPCIVLVARQTDCVIAYGTSTAGRDYPHVRVDDKTVTGRVLRLANPTYFYKPNIVAVASERVEVFNPGRCGAQVFVQLRALAELD